MKSVLFILTLITTNCLGQIQQKALKTFTQKDFNAYKFEENKYDLRTKNSFLYLRTENDTSSYYLDPSDYKGIINYGVDFASRDKRTFNFFEYYYVYYTNVKIEKCTFSMSDSIAEIEGQITGGWDSMDFKGKPPVDAVEISVGELKKSFAVISFGNFNMVDYKVTYQGEEKKESFILDTLNTLEFQKIDFRKNFPSSTPFKVRFKVDKNSVLSIGKLSCYTHFYNIGEMFFAQQKRKGIITPKKDKNAPRFVKIIENNVQVNDPKNQIKKETPLYYQLTEKAETYILTRQYAKAKETYMLLAKEYPTLFARDIHNAIRVAVLSRDMKNAFIWGEELAKKGIELPYFNSKIFNGLKKNLEWKSFSKKYDSICKLSQTKWNSNLKKQVNDLLNEDQADYGLENRKEPVVLYETTERVTDKLIDLLKKEGYPSEEKIGAFTKNDTILIQSPEFSVIIRHAVQQKSKGLNELNELLEQSNKALEFDLKRSNTHRNFHGACFHIYKGNLYIDKSCDYNSDAMVKKMAFMFNNPNGFIIDNGNFIVSEYNPENPKEWDDHYNNNFKLVTKLTDDWTFYEK
ncbi:hypothetical protein WFZ85_10350 [Flavobacterium sp. j3]|uniref:Uncharacterized protein n=1 Tax=Flavobacterium aureirubrum TaxID=3133147 RepID=A0ABU9N8C6_9FLAO